MYEDLLGQLLGTTTKKLVLKDVNIGTTALRQGLNRALVRFNASMEIMMMPAIEGKILVSKPNQAGNITLRLSTASPAKISYVIVTEEGDDNGKENEPIL